MTERTGDVAIGLVRLGARTSLSAARLAMAADTTATPM